VGLCVGFLEDEDAVVVVAVASSSCAARSLVSDGRVLSRSCWMSLRGEGNVRCLRSR